MTAVGSLLSLAGISCLAVLIYWPWQELCTAFARQRLFEKRDTIFDLAAEGKLSFRDPDYRSIRVLLEKSIRFAHEVTVPRLIFYYIILWKSGGLDSKPELLKAVERIEDAETRGIVFALVRDALNTLLLMAIIKSPWAMFLLIPAYVLVVIAHIGRRFARTLRDNSQTLIQLEAERVGSSLDSAAA
jgi:hypothetical protein